ncbi:MAG: folate-binding protein [Pseudomonadota bacterium]
MNSNANHSERTIIAIAGEGVRSFLQGLITNDVDKLAPGAPLFASLLTPQGKILFDFFLFDSDETVFADIRAEHAETFAKRLKLYKLRAKITIEPRPDLAVITNATPKAGLTGGPDPRHADLGWRGLVVGQDAISDDAYSTRRIALGVPEFGVDFEPESVFPMDVNADALNGVDYKKGCFVGQEVASRMKRKGAVRKRTLIAQIDGAAPAKGADIKAGGSTIGETFGVGLALIRLDRWDKAKDAGAQPTCDGASVAIATPSYLEDT